MMRSIPPGTKKVRHPPESGVPTRDVGAASLSKSNKNKKRKFHVQEPMMIAIYLTEAGEVVIVGVRR